MTPVLGHDIILSCQPLLPSTTLSRDQPPPVYLIPINGSSRDDRNRYHRSVNTVDERLRAKAEGSTSLADTCLRLESNETCCL